jgi:preprotein translocase subunit YajC
MQLIILQAGGMAGGLQFLFPILIIGIFYFFMLRPQMQQQKKVQTFQSSLAANMEVVTSSGIIGKITKLDDHTITLLVDEKTKIRVLRNTISAEFSSSTKEIA